MHLRALELRSLALVAGAVLATSAAAQSTTRLSVNSAGAQANFSSYAPATSADGRYVAFDSDTTNLVTGDTNNRSDVFVRDRQTNLTTRVSVDSTGIQGNDSSWFPSISADGRYVAFWSSATNLVGNDTNGTYDVFVHDRQLGQTSRVSVGLAGAQGNGGSYSPSLSADGRYVAFWSYANDLVSGDTNGWADVFVHDRQLSLTTRVSVDSGGGQANFSCNYPSLSADGRYVAFESSAGNLAPGDDPLSQIPDIFVHDRQTGLTTRVSADSNGVKGISGSMRPSISANGRYVAFESLAPNLVPGDTNNASDVFVHDRQTSQTIRISVTSSGVQGDYISGDAAISADGRHVAFASLATNLVAGDTNNLIDVYVRDLQLGQTSRVSVSTAGTQANQGSVSPSLSSDGRCVAFDSVATNLVSFDSNGTSDVFLRDSGVSPAWANLGFGLSGANGLPQLSASGALVMGGTTTLQVSSAASTALGAMVFGLSNLALPVYGGVLVPSLDLLLALGTSASGQAQKVIAWPLGLPAGLSVYVQTWLLDASGTQGFAATNALTATAS
jgi:Tol biopolymer transport system component